MKIGDNIFTSRPALIKAIRDDKNSIIPLILSDIGFFINEFSPDKIPYILKYDGQEDLDHLISCYNIIKNVFRNPELADYYIKLYESEEKFNILRKSNLSPQKKILLGAICELLLVDIDNELINAVITDVPNLLNNGNTSIESNRFRIQPLQNDIVCVIDYNNTNEHQYCDIVDYGIFAYPDNSEVFILLDKNHQFISSDDNIANFLNKLKVKFGIYYPVSFEIKESSIDITLNNNTIRNFSISKD